MRRIITIIFTMSFATCGYADAVRGKQLFDKAQCMSCHNVEDFQNKKIRKAKTFEQMKGRISACQIQHDAQWFDDDEHDVAMYLNKEYYHFKEKE